MGCFSLDCPSSSHRIHLRLRPLNSRSILTDHRSSQIDVILQKRKEGVRIDGGIHASASVSLPSEKSSRCRPQPKRRFDGARGCVRLQFSSLASLLRRLLCSRKHRPSGEDIDPAVSTCAYGYKSKWYGKEPVLPCLPVRTLYSDEPPDSGQPYTAWRYRKF